ncbi:MAG: pyridoxamine 5'-phosphate oxidase family protein [Pseudomonadota bacterium]
MADWWETLEETRAEVWRRITRGVADRRAPARHPALATQGLDGFAEARVVVLRGADQEAATLEIHTDTASAKVTELRAASGATLLVWEEMASLQIRLRCNIEIVEGEEAAARWKLVPAGSRKVYGGDPPTGQPIDRPQDFTPTPDPDRFAVLTCKIAEIETVHLGREQHRRALFRASDGWRGQWLVP